MRSSVRSTVDLPHPEGPMNAVTFVGFDVDVHVFHGQEVAVVDVQMIDIIRCPI